MESRQRVGAAVQQRLVGASKTVAYRVAYSLETRNRIAVAIENL